jgi:hypothetical protein
MPVTFFASGARGVKVTCTPISRRSFLPHLTLLSLIIGFSFAMAGDRYGQRKSFEEAEVNAVGIEYVRVGLRPDADAAGVRALLAKYVVSNGMQSGPRIGI